MAFGVHHTQLTGGDEFDTLPGLVYCPLTHGQILVLGALLAHGDEGGGFGETVHVGDGPPEVVLEAFDGFGGRRSSRGDHVHTGGDLATVGPRGVGRLAQPVHVLGVERVRGLAVEPQPRAGQLPHHVEHSQVICSFRSSSKTRAGSITGRHTWVAPAAVTVHV